MLSAAAMAVTPMTAGQSMAAQAGVGASAQPLPGSRQREAILDALRPAVEAKLGPRVEFVVQTMRVRNGWAFVQAEPQRRGGGAINGRAYFSEWEHMDGLTTTAVLRYQIGRWNLVDHAIGATDVWYCGLGPRTLASDHGC